MESSRVAPNTTAATIRDAVPIHPPALAGIAADAAASSSVSTRQSIP
jgi:hypothetical protein